MIAWEMWLLGSLALLSLAWDVWAVATVMATPLYPCSRCVKRLTGYLGGMCDDCRAVVAGRAQEGSHAR